MSKIDKYEKIIKNSKVQTEMHLPTGKKGDINDIKNVLYSAHQRGKQKTLWYQSSWESMTDRNVPTNPELVTYKSKIFPYHSLHRSLLSTLTPEIKAKEGYEIRFCDDLFINMIKEFRLSFNDTEIQYGNDKFLSFNLKLRKDWDTIFREVGNRETLVSWSDTLKSEFISIYLPWCYSKDKSDAFPLNLCGQSDRLEHIIEFNLKLSNLILVREVESGNLLEFDRSFIEVSGNLESIPIPEMEGLYTTLTSKECEYINCIKDEDNGNKEYFSESIYYIEDENETTLGKKVHLKIDPKNNYPVNTIFWGALNVTLSENEKNSVYHFIENDELYSPVKTTKIESSVGTVLENKSSYKTEKGYSSSQFERIPGVPGFNLWKNSVLQKDDPRKFLPGIKFNSGSLIMTLNEKTKTSNNKYLAFCILCHYKKFLFTNYPKTQEERLHKGATITLLEDN